MTAAEEVARGYRFAQFELDLLRGSLSGPSGELTLRPKSLEVLRHLVVNAGRLLSRDDLLDAVWHEVTVTEESLTQCISEIRQTLGDSDQRLIRTAPRRGYMFAAPVEIIERTGSRDAPPAPSASSVRPTLVILPFANLSGDPAQEYLADALTEDITASLSQFGEIAIIARQSAFAFKGKAQDVRDVSRTLDARYVVEGSIRRVGTHIRASARLIDGERGSQRWSDRVERELGDFGDVMDDITRSIVRSIVAQVGLAEEERALRLPGDRDSAYELALRGDAEMRAFLRTWSVDRLYVARRCFEAALRIEPDNAKIAAELGNAFVRAYHEPLDADYTNSDVLQRGHDLIARAVALDPFLPLARAHLGWALMWMRQHDASVAEFQRAVELNPNFIDFRFAAALVYAGSPDRALAALDHGIRAERMHNAHTHSIRGHALYLLRRYAEAEPPLRENIRQIPRVPVGRVWLTAVLMELGRTDEARSEASDLMLLAPAFTLDRWPAFKLYRDPRETERIVQTLSRAGLQ